MGDNKENNNENKGLNKIITSVTDSIVKRHQNDIATANTIQEKKNEIALIQKTKYTITFDINLGDKEDDKQNDNKLYSNITVNIKKIDANTQDNGNSFNNLSDLLLSFESFIPENDKTENFSRIQELYNKITGGSKLTINFSITLKLGVENDIVIVDKIFKHDQKVNVYSDYLKQGSEFKKDNNDVEIIFDNIDEDKKEQIKKDINNFLLLDEDNYEEEMVKTDNIDELYKKYTSKSPTTSASTTSATGGGKASKKMEDVFSLTNIQKNITGKSEAEKLYNFLGYSLLRIEKIMYIFNSDIFTKIFTLLADSKYKNTSNNNDNNKYINYLNNIFIKINLQEFKDNLYKDENKIYNIIDINSLKYKEIFFPHMKDADFSASKYMFTYTLLENFIDDFFNKGKTPVIDDFANFTSIGRNDEPNTVTKIKILLKYVLTIEKKTIELIDKINNLRDEEKPTIEEQYYDLMKSKKRVVTIVKRRHDNFEYDNNHPFFITHKKEFQSGSDSSKKLYYLDIYYQNQMNNKKVFSYVPFFGNYKKTLLNDKQDELKKYNSIDKLTSGEDDRKPLYFYKDGDNLKKVDTKTFNELHKFGPFDYLYNKPVENEQIAADIERDLSSKLENNNAMMIGIGQSGSGKTSTLIQLVTEQKKQLGVLLHYLEKTKLYMVQIECVNLYCNPDSFNENIDNIEKFTYDNYLTQIYGGKNNSGNDILYSIKNYTDLSKSYDRTIIDDVWLDWNEIYKVKHFPNLTTEEWSKKKKEMKKQSLEQLGETILKLFDRRQILPSPNNPKSSRSHIIVCLTLNTEVEGYDRSNYKINDKKLIVCDLAGVENKFLCEQEAELFDAKYEIIKNKAHPEGGSQDTQAQLIENELYDKTCDDKNECCEGIKKSINDYKRDFKLDETLTTFDEVKSALATNTKGIEEYKKSFLEIFKALFVKPKDGTAIYRKFTNYLQLYVILHDISQKDTLFQLYNLYEKIIFFKENNVDIYNIEITLKEGDISNMNLLDEYYNNNQNIKNDYIYLYDICNIINNYEFPEKLQIDVNKTVNNIIKFKKNFQENKIILIRLFHTVKIFAGTYNFTVAKIFYNYILKHYDINDEYKLKLSINKNGLVTATRPIDYLKALVLGNYKDYSKLISSDSFITVFNTIFTQNAFNDDIREIKTNISNNFKILEEMKKKYGETGQCLEERKKKIIDDCGKRVIEGYMINKSLSELSSGISRIVSENAYFGSPIYFERQIAPSCRNNFLDYYNFDKYDKLSKSESNNIEEDIEKYGIILCIIKYYFGIKLDQLFIYTLLVYNTTFFDAPKEYKIPAKEFDKEVVEYYNNHNGDKVSYPEPLLGINIGEKNNPPNPPYVNTNILKYYTYINNNNKDTLLHIARKFKDYLKNYDFYKPFYQSKDNNLPIDKYLRTPDTNSNLSGIINILKEWINFIESNNAGTLLGTFETADSMQSITFKDIKCSKISDTKDNDYNEILNTFNKDTAEVNNNVIENIVNSPFNESNIKEEYITQLLKPPEFDGSEKTTGGGRKTRKKKRKRNKTVGKKVIRFNRSKLRTKKPKKTKRK